MVAFATADDLAGRLRIEFTAAEELQAAELLDDVSAEIAEYCDAMAFERTVDDDIVLEGARGRRLILPGAPIVSVASVSVDGTALAAADYDLVVRRLYRDGGWGGPEAKVEVTYTHGYDTGEIPAVFRSVCLRAAARVWPNPEGFASRQLPDLQVGFNRDTLAGTLTATDQHLLRRYRWTHEDRDDDD